MDDTSTLRALWPLSLAIGPVRRRWHWPFGIWTFWRYPSADVEGALPPRVPRPPEFVLQDEAGWVARKAPVRRRCPPPRLILGVHPAAHGLDRAAYLLGFQPSFL